MGIQVLHRDQEKRCKYKKKTYVIQPKSQKFNPFFKGGGGWRGGEVEGIAGIVNYWKNIWKLHQCDKPWQTDGINV